MLFLEDKTFKNCECNSTWINICYNPAVLEPMLESIVINAGLYLSPYSQLVDFLYEITNEMSTILGKINYPIVEQAIVNKLIYVDKTVCILESNHVNNMAQQIKTKADNKINHQYKVFPKIKSELYNKYAN
jgi:hypothetical protein